MTTTEELEEKLVNVEEFLGVFACNIVPEIYDYPASLIINTQPLPNSGEHWVAIYISEDGLGTYFDSYGNEPQKIEFVSFLNENCPAGWYHNSTLLQGTTSIKCGEYCVLFVYLRSKRMTMCDIITWFTTNQEINDDVLRDIYKKL
jgi:hypothetical protein